MYKSIVIYLEQIANEILKRYHLKYKKIKCLDMMLRKNISDFYTEYYRKLGNISINSGTYYAHSLVNSYVQHS